MGKSENSIKLIIATVGTALFYERISHLNSFNRKCFLNILKQMLSLFCSLLVIHSEFNWKKLVAFYNLFITFFCISSFAIHFLILHLSRLQALLVVGTFFPDFLPNWSMENLSLWLSLLEGMALPVVLGLCDANFSEAAVNSCSSRQRSTYIGGNYININAFITIYFIEMSLY